jgi:hypothetical protein
MLEILLVLAQFIKTPHIKILTGQSTYLMRGSSLNTNMERLITLNLQ